MTRAVVGLVTAFTRQLVCRDPRVPAAGKLLRAALFLGPFCLAYALLKLHVLFTGRPVAFEAAADFGPRFTCRLPDLIQTYIHLFGVWEPDVTAFVRRRLSPGDTFIDVGANVGYHTLLAAGLVGDAGRVVAIEASPANFAALTESLAFNENPKAVRTANRAAADVAGTVSIYSGPVHNVGLATTVESRGLRPEAEVEAAPLADLLESQETAAARLVKIDVEGGEDLVIRGMAGFLERCPDDVEILLELSPKWWSDRQQTVQQVLAPLLDAGFHAYGIDNNLWPWRYLWPNDVRKPRRLRSLPTRRVKRVDLVLSRLDQEEL